ncbi:MAG: fibrobacter succinogenes major paralogous domain-containing protein [Bacteroidota bacterium]
MKKVVVAFAVILLIVFNSDFGKEPKARISDFVKIGLQVWMSKNLDVVCYRNGDTIPQVKNEQEWANLKTGAWCYNKNDSNNVKIYGKLYNWYAVNDPRGLAPEGSHIPSDAEWTELTEFLGGICAGGKLKEKGYKHWSKPNTLATNQSGFSALPGGFRDSKGTFINIKYDARWWTSTDCDIHNAWDRSVVSEYNFTGRLCVSKASGFSVRCVKN